MQQCRLAETGRLREANISRYDRTKHAAIKMLYQLHRHFIRKIVARIEHRSQDSEHFETRIHRVANLFDRIEQRAQSFERVILALHGNQHAICRSQRVNGQHVYRRRAVNQYEIIQAGDRRKRLSQLHLTTDFL